MTPTAHGVDWTLHTGVVALRHGRRFIGIDASPDYIDKHVVPRLTLPLFDGAASC